MLGGLKMETGSVFFSFKFCRCHLLVKQKNLVFTAFRLPKFGVNLSKGPGDVKRTGRAEDFAIGCCP